MSRDSGSLRTGQNTPESRDLQAPARRQDVVGPQVAGRRVVVEVGGVVRGVAPVGQVGAALQLRGLHRAGRGGLRVADPRGVEQLDDRLVHRVAVQRVGVLVAHDHEPRPRPQSAAAALVVVDVAAAPGLT